MIRIRRAWLATVGALALSGSGIVALWPRSDVTFYTLGASRVAVAASLRVGPWARRAEAAGPGCCDAPLLALSAPALFPAVLRVVVRTPAGGTLAVLRRAVPLRGGTQVWLAVMVGGPDPHRPPDRGGLECVDASEPVPLRGRPDTLWLLRTVQTRGAVC
jgi:hypothetical protein